MKCMITIQTKDVVLDIIKYISTDRLKLIFFSNIFGINLKQKK